MKTRNYMKREVKEVENEFLDDEILISSITKKTNKAKWIFFAAALFLITPVLLLTVGKQLTNVSVAEMQSVQVATLPIASAVSKRTTLTIPSGTVKANPFLPYRDLGDSQGALDVPGYSLTEPPKVSGASSDAVRVMDTVVSGILYDKFNPSAILNIEGNDYLVKKGDVVNNYKVLAIAQDSVTVQLGSNVYKAGIGEMLTEGSLNHNDVSNLDNKFGGAR